MHICRALASPTSQLESLRSHRSLRYVIPNGKVQQQDGGCFKVFQVA